MLRLLYYKLGDLKEQKVTVSQFWRPQVQTPSFSRIGSFWGLNEGSVAGLSSVTRGHPHVHMTFSLRASVSSVLLLQGHRLWWIRTLYNDPILSTNGIFHKPFFQIRSLAQILGVRISMYEFWEDSSSHNTYGHIIHTSNNWSIRINK